MNIKQKSLAKNLIWQDLLWTPYNYSNEQYYDLVVISYFRMVK